MKMRKLAAFLAASVAVTSLSVAAFADAAPETEAITLTESNGNYATIPMSTLNKYSSIEFKIKAKTLADCGHEINGTGESDGSKHTAGMETTDFCPWAALAVVGDPSGIETDVSSSKKNGWWQPNNPLKVDGTPDAEGYITKTLTVEDMVKSITEDTDWESTFTLNGIALANWGAVSATAIGTKKPAESSSDSSSSSSSDPVDPPAAGDKTLTFTSNHWTTDDGEVYNAQGEVVVKSGTVAEIKALDNYTEELTVKTVTNGTIGDIQCVAVLTGDGVKNGYAARYEGESQAYNITLNSAFTIKFDKAWVAENLLETGNVQMKVIFSTKTSGSEELEAFPVLTYTNKQQGSGEGEGSGSGSSTAAPAEPDVPNIRPVAPTTEAPATTTAAPEVVTAANGESVEAPKDVIPSGAVLEVKEQPKEEAVKAVEAIKSTDENKEVVETVKKAVEDDKAAVMDINLVKDGAKIQPDGTIKVTINVPAALKDAANLFVYRVEEDGKLTDVKASVVNGKLVFSTSHFSTYIITSEALSGDAVVTEATEAPAATTAAPADPEKTDDKNQATGVVIAVIPAVIAAAGVVISKKRK